MKEHLNLRYSDLRDLKDRLDSIQPPEVGNDPELMRMADDFVDKLEAASESLDKIADRMIIKFQKIRK